MTLAIGLHNIPEGLAVALVSVPRGENPWRAALWAGNDGCYAPIVFVSCARVP
jgi:zinc transporter ZupT